MSSFCIIKITEADRLQTAKDIVLQHRAKAGARASYELYGIDYNRKPILVTRIAHAPTSADFAPMIAKTRIGTLIDRHNMVVEFRGAWKAEDQGKVVAYESAQQIEINRNK
jgi:hypothetical protein